MLFQKIKTFFSPQREQLSLGGLSDEAMQPASRRTAGAGQHNTLMCESLSAHTFRRSFIPAKN